MIQTQNIARNLERLTKEFSNDQNRAFFSGKSHLKIFRCSKLHYGALALLGSTALKTFYQNPVT